MVISHLHPLLDSLVESLCKPWLGIVNVLQICDCDSLCVVMLWMKCGRALFSPSAGVASLRPRLGGEPPWFPSCFSFVQVFFGEFWKPDVMESISCLGVDVLLLC